MMSFPAAATQAGVHLLHRGRRSRRHPLGRAPIRAHSGGGGALCHRISHTYERAMGRRGGRGARGRGEGARALGTARCFPCRAPPPAHNSSPRALAPSFVHRPSTHAASHPSRNVPHDLSASSPATDGQTSPWLIRSQDVPRPLPHDHEHISEPRPRGSAPVGRQQCPPPRDCASGGRKRPPAASMTLTCERRHFLRCLLSGMCRHFAI